MSRHASQALRQRASLAGSALRWFTFSVFDSPCQGGFIFEDNTPLYTQPMETQHPMTDSDQTPSDIARLVSRLSNIEVLLRDFKTESSGIQFEGQPGPFYAALAKAQANFAPLVKGRTVTVRPKDKPSYTFKYAELDDVLASVRPALNEQGFALLSPFAGSPETGYVVRTMLAHESGILSTECRFAATVKGQTGTFPKRLQEIGSDRTYLARYGIVGLLGLAADDDDDGNKADGNEVQSVQRRGDKSEPAKAAAPRSPRAPKEPAKVEPKPVPAPTPQKQPESVAPQPPQEEPEPEEPPQDEPPVETERELDGDETDGPMQSMTQERIGALVKKLRIPASESRTWLHNNHGIASPRELNERDDGEKIGREFLEYLEGREQELGV